MSVYLHGLAMRANLSNNLKAVLMALCDAAGEDDGTHCYPSLAYISHKTGFSKRHCIRLIRALEVAEYIEPVAYLTGGRGHTTWYRIHIKRVPMKPDWSEVKRRLIEAGELAADDDIPQGAKRVGKGAKTLKDDKMSPFSQNSVKDDKMSPFSPVKDDKMSPFSGERMTKCHPNILIESYDSYKDEDSYADIPASQKEAQETEPEAVAPIPSDAPSSPPPPPPSRDGPDPARLWRRVKDHIRQRQVGAAALATWLEPVRCVAVEQDGVFLLVTLVCPGSEHARILEQRYHGLLVGAFGALTYRTGSHVEIVYETQNVITSPAPAEALEAHA